MPDEDVILRHPDGLMALTVRPTREFADPDGKPEALDQAWREGGRYEFVETPLNSAGPPLPPPRLHLWKAWHALGNVRGLDGPVREHVQTVLRETVLGSCARAVLPVPAWECRAATTRPRPTAAHPRAYRGTTYQPPTPPSVPAVDLRSYLCDARGLCWLHEALGREGEDSDGESAFPEAFRVRLWPWLRPSGADSGEWLALFYALRLDSRPTLLAAVACLLTLDASLNVLHWCHVVSEQPEEWQETFLSLVIESGAYKHHAKRLGPEDRARFAEVLTGRFPAYHLFCLLRALAVGLDPEYLMAGFRLAERSRSGYCFTDVTARGDYPEQAILGLMEYLDGAEGYYDGLAHTVWECCARLSGLGQVIEAVEWERLSPDSACRYLKLVINSGWRDLSPEERVVKWKVVQELSGRMEEELRGVLPSYQAKWLAEMGEFLWQWNTPQELAAVSDAFVLLRRLTVPPFDPNRETANVTSDYLVNVDGSLRHQFLEAPDSSFRRLEQECRSHNTADLIGLGTWTLTRLLPFLAVGGFVDYPGLLCRVAKLLGCLPEPMREGVVREFASRPLMDESLEDLPLTDAVALLDARREAAFDPVPRRLREHLAGRRTLTDDVLARDVAQMHRQVTRTRLEVLEQDVLALLREDFPLDTAHEAVRHALQMYRWADKDNRRAFRKFLHALGRGQTDYRERHPQTRAWWAKHPRLDEEAWQRGVRLTVELPGYGTVMLAVETDPLEALRLGTHVGSCLGLGGSFAYSAMAVVLDANKQVVYARDAKGNVLARQTVALSDEERLVCFSVYPRESGVALRRAFADFDREWAAALGVPLYNPDGEEEYTISPVLSHAWWDDFAWGVKKDGRA